MPEGQLRHRRGPGSFSGAAAASGPAIVGEAECDIEVWDASGRLSLSVRRINMLTVPPADPGARSSRAA